MKLTNTTSTAKMPAPQHEGGRENPFRTGDKTPLSTVVFLCPSFLGQLKFEPFKFIMAGLPGQALCLVAPVRGITTPFNPVANTVVSISGDYSILRTGITV